MCIIQKCFQHVVSSLHYTEALAARKGVTLEGQAEEPAVYRERQYDLLADTVRRSLDMQKIYEILEEQA